MIEKIRRQFGDDPARWRREMEAEWAEDEDVWLPQSLIVSCVGTAKNCGEDLQHSILRRDYEGRVFRWFRSCADPRLLRFQRSGEALTIGFILRHLKIFQQPTKYAHVLGYIKPFQDRWGSFEKIRVDYHP